MKGCLYPIFKLIVFFVVFFIFTGSIHSFILPTPESYDKDRSLLTSKQRIEIQKYHNKFRFYLTYAQFLAFPPTILTTYLIFREKKKGRGDHKPKS